MEKNGLDSFGVPEKVYENRLRERSFLQDFLLPATQFVTHSDLNLARY